MNCANNYCIIILFSDNKIVVIPQMDVKRQ